MANIRIDLDHAPLYGETVTFKAPCDASQITGLVIYYANTSKEFTLTDANGGDIGMVDNIFAAGAIVKVILDTDANNAFVQNPDTNTYLEGRFDGCVPKTRKVNGKGLSSDIALNASDVGAAPSSHGNHVPTTETANNARFLRNDNTWQAVTPANIGAAASSHNQAASTITAGTFAGQVVAKSSAQTPGTSLLRNSKLVSAETNPTVNGEIFWLYE